MVISVELRFVHLIHDIIQIWNLFNDRNGRKEKESLRKRGSLPDIRKKPHPAHTSLRRTLFLDETFGRENRLTPHSFIQRETV